jgi:hypothetical protein
MTPMRSLLLGLLLLAGCIQPRSKECTETCARESDCIATTKSEVPFDEKECVAACEVLRGDQQNLAKVEQHRKCVLEATTCPAALECP